MTSLRLSPDRLRAHLAAGQVIPAHPLALDAAGRLSERHQRALSRYYIAAGAGALAVGVHTTQFAIRDPAHGLLRPVLELAAEVAAAADRPVPLIAGVCGATSQAVAEAELARDVGCSAGLLSLAGWDDAPDDALIAHCRAVARVIPVFGFYLQPAAGGRPLNYAFWRAFFDIPEVVAVKVAPFSRYESATVMRALAASGRDDVAAYTGNDDAIVADLLTAFPRGTGGELRFAGGLLGQWAVWTSRAVELHAACRAPAADCRALLAYGARLTIANAAIFDAANGFRGCIAGINSILHSQGLMASPRCLDPDEQLSPGQLDAIATVCREWPDLADDEFVATHLDEWLA